MRKTHHYINYLIVFDYKVLNSCVFKEQFLILMKLWVFSEVRMQERVFLGIGNKPFIDIQPSEAAIHDRAINYALMGRGNRFAQ